MLTKVLVSGFTHDSCTRVTNVVLVNTEEEAAPHAQV